MGGGLLVFTRELGWAAGLGGARFRAGGAGRGGVASCMRALRRLLPEQAVVTRSVLKLHPAGEKLRCARCAGGVERHQQPHQPL